MAPVPQTLRPFPAAPRRATVEAFLLGPVQYARFLTLQRQAAFDSHSRADGRITLFLCEHPAAITIGREGRRTDVGVPRPLLAGRPVPIVEADRGGGALLHGPGQLAVCPIVPLDWHGWSVGNYLARLQTGIAGALAELGVTAHTRPGRHGLWGASGQLAVMGAGVRHWATHFGAYLQVHPPLPLARYVKSDPREATPLGAVNFEGARGVTMSRLRSRLVRGLADTFDCPEYHVHTGHPLLERIARDGRLRSRAS